MGKKIAVFPEPGAIGPVMNLVGICQGLKEMGHDPVFVLEPGLKGTVES
ncbi:MAG TPA: glycosyl transferase family 1, partial [Alphaproteobacteria bacterium]|nr:glycosyl transferase family 1 [Alphaproteobacteria bacterium]